MTVSALSLDFESDELRARRMEGILAAAAALPPIQPVVKTPEGLSGVSSLAKAEARDAAAPRQRPQLEEPLFPKNEAFSEAPKKHFMYGLIRSHGELEKVADKQTRLFETQVRRDMAEINRLDAEKTEKLRKQAESAKKLDTWGVFAQVAQYVASAATIGIGIGLLATGVASVAGGLLIGSGVLGLSGRIMHDTGAFNAIAAWFHKSEELQKKLAAKIEMGMFFLSFGLGLGAGIGAYQAGGFAAMTTATKIGKIATGVGVGASLASSGIRFGMSFTEKKVSHLRADLMNIDTRTNQLYQDIYQNCREVQNLVDTASDIGDEIKHAISASTVHFDE